ncbi:methyltransferase domain-containing protein [Mesorhizobium sp. CAU 1732]|uniref:methyltransferase domain-containing protein n=1 Tax=Mesorhizobium sp. CAU 1732 TaxID=3140358 RepID=UPI0032605733
MLEEHTWRGVASGEQPGWEWRARIIAKHIEPGERVFDFGAGNRKLARFIPPNCIYTPIDAVNEIPGTFVVDYNTHFALPEGGFSVAVCAGFLEYLEDVPNFFKNISASSPGSKIIFSYLFPEKSPPRKEMILTNRYPSLNDILDVVSPYISYARVVTGVNNTCIVKAVLGRDASDHALRNWSDLEPIDDIFLRTKKRFSIRRIFGLRTSR